MSLNYKFFTRYLQLEGRQLQPLLEVIFHKSYDDSNLKGNFYEGILARRAAEEWRCGI